MQKIFKADWFEMPEIRRRSLSSGVWIPLRQEETLKTGGTQNRPEFYEEILFVASLAVHNSQRALGQTLGWMEIGLLHTPSPYAFKDGRYKPADQYWHNDKEPAVGIELILLNSLNSDHKTEWLVNQDLVLALGLIQEGDCWIRPDEGYIDVIRQRRDSDNEVIAIEIRAEHLRDYLCARNLALRLVQYRERLEIVNDASHIPWRDKPKEEKTEEETFSLCAFPISRDCGSLGGVSVMTIWRTDVDHEVDVPQYGTDDDSNTNFESYQFDRQGPTIELIKEELWRNEWVEPATASERIRRDKPTEILYYFTGAAGEKSSGDELDNETVISYLWFKAEVMERLLTFRGSSLKWYSAETGSIKCSPDYKVHFGINEQCHINVLACDIVRLPLWQQKIWHGFNISPDGPPSKELQDAQLRCDPAKTSAPEVAFQNLFENLNDLFKKLYGEPLFKPHERTSEIMKQCHRFRALKINEVLALAKDISRLTVDSINISLLRKLLNIGPKDNDNQLKGLKLLEKLLTKYVKEDKAREIMGPLHIAYNLRLGDAHLPSKVDIDKALTELNVRANTHSLRVSMMLLEKICECLLGIGQIIHENSQASLNAINGELDQKQ